MSSVVGNHELHPVHKRSMKSINQIKSPYLKIWILLYYEHNLIQSPNLQACPCRVQVL